MMIVVVTIVICIITFSSSSLSPFFLVVLSLSSSSLSLSLSSSSSSSLQLVVLLLLKVTNIIMNMITTLTQMWYKGIILVNVCLKACSVTTFKRTVFIANNNNNSNCIQRRSLRLFTISSLCSELSPTRTLKWPRHNHVKIMCNTSSAYHVQHVVCHLVWRDSSAIKLDRVRRAFILV